MKDSWQGVSINLISPCTVTKVFGEAEVLHGAQAGLKNLLSQDIIFNHLSLVSHLSLEIFCS